MHNKTGFVRYNPCRAPNPQFATAILVVHLISTSFNIVNRFFPLQRNIITRNRAFKSAEQSCCQARKQYASKQFMREWKVLTDSNEKFLCFIQQIRTLHSLVISITPFCACFNRALFKNKSARCDNENYLRGSSNGYEERVIVVILCS